MPRSRWTTLGISALIHGGIVLAALLTIAVPVVRSGGGSSVVLDVTPPLEAVASPPEPDEVRPPVWDEPETALPAPRLPDLPRPAPRAEPVEDLPPLEADETLIVLPEIAVRVAWLPARRPAPAAPTVSSAPAPPASPPPARATAPLVPLRAPRHYPAEAWRQRLEGRARVAIEVDADGHVTAARLVESAGHPILDRAAVESARQWLFRPPGEVRRAVIPFRYDLP